MLALLCYVVGFVLLLLAAFGVGGRVNLLALGLAAWLAGEHLVGVL